jgi:hypothetical protein
VEEKEGKGSSDGQLVISIFHTSSFPSIMADRVCLPSPLSWYFFTDDEHRAEVAPEA